MSYVDCHTAMLLKNVEYQVHLFCNFISSDYNSGLVLLFLFFRFTFWSRFSSHKSRLSPLTADLTHHCFKTIHSRRNREIEAKYSLKIDTGK